MYYTSNMNRLEPTGNCIATISLRHSVLTATSKDFNLAVNVIPRIHLHSHSQSRMK